MHASLSQPFMTGASILVVGDDQASNQWLRQVLTQGGYPVIIAAHGTEALAHDAQQAIGLVLLDVMCPQTEGLALCQELRRDSAVPIILLASPDQPDVMVQGLAAGADDALVYPVPAQELTARVGALLRRLQWMAVGTRPLAPFSLPSQLHGEGTQQRWGWLAPTFDAAD